MKTEITLPVSELKTALLGLNKVIGRSSTLPVLQSVRFTRDQAGAVYIHGTDLDSFITYKAQEPHPGPETEFLVPMQALSKAVKGSSPKESVGFVYEGKERIKIRTFAANSPIDQVVEGPGIKDWPPAPEVLEKGVSLDEAFKEALKQAFECSSHDDSRYILQGAFLDVSNKEGHYVVATDGRIMFSANSFCLDLKQSVVIPNRKFLNWNPFLEDGTCSLAVQPPKDKEQSGWVQLKSEHWTFVTREIIGNYPKWKVVIPNGEPNTTIRIPEDAINTVLEIIARIPGDQEPNYPITLNVSKAGLTLEGRNKDQAQPASVPVGNAIVQGKPITVCLNRYYLARALRFGLNEIHIIDELTPMTAFSGGKRMIIMPVRPDGPSSAASTETPNPPKQTSEEIPSPEIKKEERTDMRKSPAATTETVREPETTVEVSESPLKKAMQHVEKIKETLKTVLSDFSEVLDVLKKAEKEKKGTEKEIDAIRTTLKQIQSVKI